MTPPILWGQPPTQIATAANSPFYSDADTLKPADPGHVLPHN